MGTAGWLILIAGAALTLWIVWIFNRMIALRVRAAHAWADIDVQLKRRADLVPSLVEVVRGYTQHERQTLEEAIAARSDAAAAQPKPASERQPAESALSRGITRLFALAEAYPDLKADESFRSLHHSLIEIEEHLQASRRYYNAVVRDHNTLLEKFPHALVARLFRFRARDFFQLDSVIEAQAPSVSLGGQR